ncbi:calcyphosin-2-like [Littorina saxatilis]|uniref:Calcyphosin-2 PH domain-containing protein n=1 Tax=Littorina saxatilis TaxID=31220 RepID=A0AAN9GHP0_9CAEN
MDFGVRGIATPYAQHRPGSARRPPSARQHRNPITGEEYEPAPAVSQNTNNHNSTATHVQTRPPSRPSSKPDNVPSLNLNYLQDNEKSGAISISLRDYKLDSPGADSTVSWGTGRSGLTLFEDPRPRAPSARQNNVPDLLLGTTDRPPSARKIPKQPTAWDRDPVPEDVPAPSARHQQMYQQYADEMKQAYRTHADPQKVSEEEIQRTMQAMKKKGQQMHSARDYDNEENGDDDGEDVGEDVVDEQWKKQRYTSNQLRKKLDAEDMLDHNKKLKLLETVMVDQLSRAVISDPEQNQRNTFHGGSTSRRAARGTKRHLHDSKVSTRSTATENLLSRRVRFGARIITRNGRDAVRELTGFFFQVDRSMTVYEFKQFGKSAKAIPFIQRGVFCHPTGPKSGHPYSLCDVYSGADLTIPTKGQQALSGDLARFKNLTLRVTDVDEGEKSELLSEEVDDYTARSDAASQMDRENRHFLQVVQESAQAQISKRGIKTITGLGRHYRRLDKEGTGLLLQHDLERGLLRFHVDIPPQVLEQVFDIIDPDGERRVDYSVFMRTVLGEMNEFRKALVRKAFCKVDTHKQGSIHLSNIKKFFNANCPSQAGSDADSTKSALQSFLDEVRSSPKQEEVSFIEFEEYYEGLSLGVENDEHFANVLRNTWNI